MPRIRDKGNGEREKGSGIRDKAELRKPASSTSTLAEHLGTSPGTLKPKNNI